MCHPRPELLGPVPPRDRRPCNGASRPSGHDNSRSIQARPQLQRGLRSCRRFECRPLRHLAGSGEVGARCSGSRSTTNRNGARPEENGRGKTAPGQGASPLARCSGEGWSPTPDTRRSVGVAQRQGCSICPAASGYALGSEASPCGPRRDPPRTDPRRVAPERTESASLHHQVLTLSRSCASGW